MIERGYGYRVFSVWFFCAVISAVVLLWFSFWFAVALALASGDVARIALTVSLLSLSWLAFAILAAAASERAERKDKAGLRYACPRGHRHRISSAFCVECGAGPVLEQKALPPGPSDRDEEKE